MNHLQHRYRWLRLSKIAVIVLLGVTISGVHGISQARSLQEIRETGEIRFCIANNHPAIVVAEPEGCRDDCTLRGPVYEEALAFTETLGGNVKAVFTRVDWDEQFFNKDGKTDREAAYTPELLASGTCDIYPSHLTKIDWRLNKLDFVILFTSRIMVVVNRRNKRELKTVSDLAGKVAAVAKDTSFHTWLQAQNKTTFKDNPVRIQLITGVASVNAVNAGQVDFTLLDGDLAIWATMHQFNQAVLGFPVGPIDELGWAFRKDDKDLQAVVKQYFETERKAPYSETNKRWKRNYGLSLQEFIKMMERIK